MVGVVGGKLESGVINDSRVLATAVVKMGSVEEPSEKNMHIFQLMKNWPENFSPFDNIFFLVSTYSAHPYVLLRI